MKKTIASIMAATLFIPGFAMAAPVKDHPNNHGKQVSQAAHHKFRKGETFDRNKASNYRVLNYRDNKRLSAPPQGYRWVQSGDDALLIGITSGVVSAVVSNFIR